MAREVCKKLLKFVNVSTTPIDVHAASNRGLHEKREGKSEKHKAVHEHKMRSVLKHLGFDWGSLAAAKVQLQCFRQSFNAL